MVHEWLESRLFLERVSKVVSKELEVVGSCPVLSNHRDFESFEKGREHDFDRFIQMAGERIQSFIHVCIPGA